MYKYDLIIVGGSAAATSAGIYAVRRGLNFKIITKEFGGEVATSGEIRNWPGIPQTNGIDLSQQFKDHLKSYNVKPEEGIEVKGISKQKDGLFCIATVRGGVGFPREDKLTQDSSEIPLCDYCAKAVIVATGIRPRRLNIFGEDIFRNKGVSYCTTCDGPIFSGKIVATIGGGNSALESALMLSDIAQKVYVINKNPIFKGEQVLIDNLLKKQNVQIIYNALTQEIFGEQFVKGLKYTDTDSKENKLNIDGAFVHIGQIPNSGIVSEEVEKNKFGEIKVNANCETNIPGLYAAGDVTDVSFKQIVIASGQGCIAALSAVQYLNRLK